MASLPVIISRAAGPPGRRAALLVTLALAAAALLLLLAGGPAGAQTTVDYDDDDDGLIDITTPAQLNAIRHDTDGNGDATDTDYVNAFPNRQTGASDRMGCPGGTCTGYELAADLDLSTDYSTWTPINNYATTLDGNGYAISGLSVSYNLNGGLIRNLQSGGVVREVALLAPTVTQTSNNRSGALVGYAASGAMIDSSFVRGGTVIAASGFAKAGGLVGELGGTLRASYATATVRLSAPCNNCNTTYTGSLVAHMVGGSIIASYAAGPNQVSAGVNSEYGGLVGFVEGAATITDAYCDSQATGKSACVAARDSGVSVSDTTAEALRTAQLKQPTRYEGIYANWNLDLDGDPMTNDDPWAFGGPRSYPLLKVDKDGDGTPTCEEFSGQSCYREPGPPPYNWRADHPEIYANARTEITASCKVVTTGTGDEAVSTSTLTFDLAEYTRPITLALSLWDRTHFRSLQSLGIAMPALQRQGQTATVEVVTDPARTRFRLDGQYGLNLVLGYADCHTDDP